MGAARRRPDPWPHHRDDWPGKFAPVPGSMWRSPRHLSRVERVNIVVKGGRCATGATEQLDARE